MWKQIKNEKGRSSQPHNTPGCSLYPLCVFVSGVCGVWCLSFLSLLSLLSLESPFLLLIAPRPPLSYINSPPKKGPAHSRPLPAASPLDSDSVSLSSLFFSVLSLSLSLSLSCSLFSSFLLFFSLSFYFILFSSNYPPASFKHRFIPSFAFRTSKRDSSTFLSHFSNSNHTNFFKMPPKKTESAAAKPKAAHASYQVCPPFSHLQQSCNPAAPRLRPDARIPRRGLISFARPLDEAISCPRTTS